MQSIVINIYVDISAYAHINLWEYENDRPSITDFRGAFSSS